MPQLLALDPLLVGVPGVIPSGSPLHVHDSSQGLPEYFTLRDGKQDPWPAWADSRDVVKLYSSGMPQ